MYVISSCSSVVTFNVGKFTNSEKLHSPWSGYGRREIPDLWSAPFKASPSRKVLNSLLLVSLDTLTQLAHYIRKLRSCNLKIGMQFQDSENEQRNLEIVQIPRLRGIYVVVPSRNQYFEVSSIENKMMKYIVEPL